MQTSAVNPALLKYDVPNGINALIRLAAAFGELLPAAAPRTEAEDKWFGSNSWTTSTARTQGKLMS